MTTEVSKKLREALQLVRDGWTKGDWHKLRGGRMCYCATGAVYAAFKVNPRWSVRKVHLPKFTAMDYTFKFLAMGIPRGRFVGERFGTAEHRISTYNDARGTRKLQIERMFEKAIEAAENNF